VRPLVAHEPLVVELLPDSVQLQVQIQDIYSASWSGSLLSARWSCAGPWRTQPGTRAKAVP